MKRSLPIICAGLALATTFQSCKKDNNTSTLPNTVNVTGLFSLTGNWNTLGIDSKVALQLATADINTYLSGKNANFRMSVSFYDTKLDASTAEANYLTAVGAGTRYFIGPQSSAELAAIQPLVDSNKTIVVSQGSTASSLAIAGDGIFRFCPNDKVEGAAIANTIYNDGIRGMVTVTRDDAGNTGLQAATGSAFVAKGGAYTAVDPYSTTLTDFSSLVAAIRTKVAIMESGYGGASHVAVYLSSFDECTALFTLAAADSTLSQVKWYGGDGVALSTAITANSAASEFAIRTGFFAPSFGLPVALQSKWQPLSDRIKAETGITPDAFALAAYDAMWVIAHTLEQTTTSTSYDSLKTTFAKQSNAYSGVTGNTALDANGDRDSGAFDYWGISRSGTTYSWVVVGESE